MENNLLVDKQEVNSVEALLSRVVKFIETEEGEGGDVPFFANNPHLLLPLGFNELKIVKNETYERNRSSVPEIPGFSFDFPQECFFRHESNGAWYWFQGITHYRAATHNGPLIEDGYYLNFFGPGNERRYEETNRFVSSLKLQTSDNGSKKLITIPKYWATHEQMRQSAVLSETVPNTLMEVAAGKISLDELHWRTLEEIVAELLRDAGMEIILTPSSADGGRDVVARGELIPGEPSLIAVEVKRKPVVGLHDVQRALRANEDFPVLMVATSGRFSAGVIAESSRSRNRFRLLLKDGLALNQWISRYAKRT